jgi:hypothetical protein
MSILQNCSEMKKDTKLTRIRMRSDGLPTLEVERDFLFASTMLVHIERLPGVTVIAKRSWAISDSFDAFFDYRGCRFYMGIPFGCIMIAPQDRRRMPGGVIDELAAHIDDYRPVWPMQLLWALARYFFLPFRPTTVGRRAH